MLLPSFATRVFASSGLAQRRRGLWAMGGWNHLSVEAESTSEAEVALNEMVRAIRTVDRDFSVFDSRSLASRLNSSAEAAYPVDDPLFLSAIASSLRWAQLLDGCFDPTVEPLMRQWGFRDQATPCATVRKRTVRRDFGHAHVTCDIANARILRESSTLEMDSGGWAKGLAAEHAVAAASQCGATTAQANCGGDIYRRTSVGSSDWDCLIRHPFGNRSSAAFRVRQRYRSAATSANYETFQSGEFGRRIGHLMDPSGGGPARTDLVSVTAFGDDGLAVDAVSSGLFVMGRERAIRWLARHPEFAALLVDQRWPADPAGVTAVGKLELTRL